MACQKVCEQGRDDIKVKVNVKSIPTSFYTAECEKDAGTGLCTFTFTSISSLPCLHTFWHAIYILLHFCFIFLVNIVSPIGNY